MSKDTPKRWSVAKTGNHQGLIVDDNTGRNVAVSYDKEDADLIAAAPELLDACHDAIAELDSGSFDIDDRLDKATGILYAAIKSAAESQEHARAATTKAESGE